MSDFLLSPFDVELVLIHYGVDLPHEEVETLFDTLVIPQEARITAKKLGGRLRGEEKLMRQTEIAMEEIAKILQAKNIIPAEAPVLNNETCFGEGEQ